MTPHEERAAAEPVDQRHADEREDEVGRSDRDRLQVGAVAIHAEDGLCDEEDPSIPGTSFGKEVAKMLEIQMLVAPEVGGRQPQSVDDRRVVELVGEDEVTGSGKCGEDADVGMVSAVEDNGGAIAVEFSESLLKPGVGGGIAGEQPRGRAGLRKLRRSGIGIPGVELAAQVGVSGQPHVVVAGEIAVNPPLPLGKGAGAMGDFTQKAQPPVRLELRHVGGQLGGQAAGT